MAMGRQTDRQGDLIMTWSEMPRSPGHVFYDRLQQVLLDAGFDNFVETTCKPFYATTMGARSVAHGRLPRMNRQRTRDRVAVLGFALVARVLAAGEPRAGSRSFLAVKDPWA